MIFILGILDILAAFILVLEFILTKYFPNEIVLVAGLYLIFKGIPFLMGGDIASIFDVFAGSVFILATFITLPTVLFLITTFILVQKGFFSLVGSDE